MCYDCGFFGGSYDYIFFILFCSKVVKETNCAIGGTGGGCGTGVWQQDFITRSSGASTIFVVSEMAANCKGKVCTLY
jgi:hypothetical protein